MKKKKYILILFVTSLFLLLTACNNKEELPVEEDKINVVTTLFPQYDFTKELLKEKGNVSILLPPGVEPHSFEPTPKDIVRINQADYFIYTGKDMEPWVDKIIKNIDTDKVQVIDVSKDIAFIEEIDHDEEGHVHEEEHNHTGVDPHFWLDPNNAKIMVSTISEVLINNEKELEIDIKENQAKYLEELNNLDSTIMKDLKNIKTRKIIYAGHFAFGYFVNRYDLEYVSPYKGFSPNAEPSPKKIAELINIMEKDNIKSIYFEELINPKIANILAEETGASTYLLHGAHNISKEELKDNITYLDIMYNNLENLKQGLGYYE